MKKLILKALLGAALVLPVAQVSAIDEATLYSLIFDLYASGEYDLANEIAMEYNHPEWAEDLALARAIEESYKTHEAWFKALLADSLPQRVDLHSRPGPLVIDGRKKVTPRESSILDFWGSDE